MTAAALLSWRGKGHAESGTSVPPRFTVLVADDDGPYRRLARALVSAVPGVTAVMEAADGAEALAIAARDRPDIVILDLTMPVMGGLDVLRKLDDVSPESYVIILTATDDRSIRELALHLGAHEFITKSSPLNVLLPSAVNSYVRARAAGRGSQDVA